MVAQAEVKHHYTLLLHEDYRNIDQVQAVNNGNRGEIMEKLRGELWEGRAVDGKLKSSLEWPNIIQNA